MQTWMKNNPCAIAEAEASFVNHEGDLMRVVPKEKTPLGAFLETSRLLRLASFFQERYLPDTHLNTTGTHYSSDEKLEQFTNWIIVTFGLIMLFAPMWWLNCIETDAQKLGVITGFIALFVLLLQGATSNRSFEVLAGTAA